MNIRNISHFEGLETVGGARGKASLFTLLEALNIRTHRGEAVPRQGQLYLYGDGDDHALLNGTINAIYEYSRDALMGVPLRTGVYREYVVSVTQDFSGVVNYYGWDGEAATDFDRINETKEDDPPVRIDLTSDELWAAEYMEWMWLTNGVEDMYKYDGLSFYRAGIEAPASAPVVALGATVWNGAGRDDTVPPTDKWRKYKYRYIRMEGDTENTIEYAASPFSQEVAVEITSNRAVNIAVTLSPDEQVTNIEIYATLFYDNDIDLDSVTFYRLDHDELNFNVGYRGRPNTSHIYEDQVANVDMTGVRYLAHPGRPDISAWFHPELDETNTWRNPPDKLKYLTYYKDRLYAVSEDDMSVPQYCDLAEPESWDKDNWLDVRKDDGDIVSGFVAHGMSLYIFKRRSIWVLTGDPDAAFSLQVMSGGERTGSQTEFGLGCTAPRSIATYGEDLVVFYSSQFGVYSIMGGQITPISQGVELTGLDDDSAGAIYADENGELFYVLSPPTGNAWVYHFRNRAWLQDDNINVSCFCADNAGNLLGGEGGYVNKFYDETQDTDNGVDFQCRLRTAWVNLRNADEDAVIRKVQVQTDNLNSNCTLTLYNEKDEDYVTTFMGTDRDVGINGISGRLFSVAFVWIKGTIESLAFHFIRRRRH